MTERKTKLILIAVISAGIFGVGFYFLALPHLNLNKTATTVTKLFGSVFPTPKFPSTGTIETPVEGTPTAVTPDVNTPAAGTSAGTTPAIVIPLATRQAFARPITDTTPQLLGKTIFRKKDQATIPVHPRFKNGNTNIAFYALCPTVACPAVGTTASPKYNFFAEDTTTGDQPFSNYWTPDPSFHKIVVVEYVNDNHQFTCSDLSLDQCIANRHFISQTSIQLVDDNAITFHIITLVENGTDGTAVPSDFMVHVKNAGADVAASPASGTAVLPGTLYTLSAGTYAVSEDANALYTQSFSGDCDLTGGITLVAGDDKTCTITNTFGPPVTTTATLHVIKQVNNSSGGTAVASDFNIHVKNAGADVAGSPTVGTAAPGSLYSLAVGIYNVSEDANTSYTPSFSGNCDITGSITLVAGDDKTCTITNNQISANTTPAALHVIKLVVNGSDGIATSSDFNIHVKNAGGDVVGSPAVGVAAPGTLYTLSAGAYAVSEDANALYTQSFSGDCDAGGNVTLLAGDNKTCTITNTQISSVPIVPPPGTGTVLATLHVIKLVVNSSDSTAVASDFNIHVKNADVDVPGSPAVGAATPGTSYSLSPGTVVISEDANIAYVQSFSGDCDSTGNITLSVGDDKTCTITNTNISVPVPTPIPEPTPTPTTSPDTTAPVIILIGDPTINLNVGDTYIEQGATATDDVDSSVAVVVSGTVDTSTAGTYIIHYNATDAADNPATEVTRTINVAESVPALPSTGSGPLMLSNSSGIIILNVILGIILASLVFLFIRKRRGSPVVKQDQQIDSTAISSAPTALVGRNNPEQPTASGDHTSTGNNQIDKPPIQTPTPEPTPLPAPKITPEPTQPENNDKEVLK
ncbi:MAG: immunoglobulin-like domain-containing protein [Candidatus Doudnabacteria bacterium]